MARCLGQSRSPLQCEATIAFSKATWHFSRVLGVYHPSTIFNVAPSQFCGVIPICYKFWIFWLHYMCSSACGYFQALNLQLGMFGLFVRHQPNSFFVGRYVQAKSGPHISRSPFVHTKQRTKIKNATSIQNREPKFPKQLTFFSSKFGHGQHISHYKIVPPLITQNSLLTRLGCHANEVVYLNYNHHRGYPHLGSV